MQVSEILQRAFGLILMSPTKGAFARDANEVDVGYADPRACSWCSLGALRKITGENNDYDRAYAYLAEAAFDIAKVDIVTINDARPSSVREEMFNRAIAAAKAREESCI
jgi:hypothetical protein